VPLEQDITIEYIRSATKTSVYMRDLYSNQDYSNALAQFNSQWQQNAIQQSKRPRSQGHFISISNNNHDESKSVSNIDENMTPYSPGATSTPQTDSTQSSVRSRSRD